MAKEATLESPTEHTHASQKSHPLHRAAGTPVKTPKHLEPFLSFIPPSKERGRGLWSEAWLALGSRADIT